MESRNIGTIEYIINKLYGQVIWCILDVTKNLTKDILESAVLATVKRHSMLRAHIEKRRLVAPSFWEFSRDNPEMVADKSGEGPVNLVQSELARNALTDGRAISKLWNIFLCGDPDAEHRSIVVLINHAISDGSSLVLWLQEIVANCNKLVTGAVSEESLLGETGEMPMCPAFESIITNWPESRGRRFSMQWVATRLGM